MRTLDLTDERGVLAGAGRDVAVGPDALQVGQLEAGDGLCQVGDKAAALGRGASVVRGDQREGAVGLEEQAENGSTGISRRCLVQPARGRLRGPGRDRTVARDSRAAVGGVARRIAQLGSAGGDGAI